MPSVVDKNWAVKSVMMSNSKFHRVQQNTALASNDLNINTKQTKPRFGRLLRPPAWKRSRSIFWKVRDRRRDRREGKMHKKGRRKNTNRKGKQKQIIRISHMHTCTAPKSTSESQAH